MSQQAVPGRSVTPWGAIFSFIIALVYGASPIDLLPDLIPIVGLVDDVIMVPLLAIMAIILLVRHNKRNKKVIHEPSRPPVIDVPVIPTSYQSTNR